MGDWRNRIIGHGTKPASEFLVNPANWRRHPRAQSRALRSVLSKVGWVQDVIENVRTGHLVDGHLRVSEALQLGDDTPVPYIQVDLSEEEERLMLATIDPLSAMAITDKEKLAELVAGDSDLRGVMLPEKLADQERKGLPLMIFPSENDWGIPTLDINLQAEAIDLPAIIWGSIARTSKMRGTWLFYTEDDRFEALWGEAQPVVDTECKAIVEVNFSVYEQWPSVLALWNTFRKRYLARWWQSKGIKVWADMNVAEPYYDLNFLGIPRGWRAYATRGYESRSESLDIEHRLALAHSGASSILFLVYGGGANIERKAREHGWLYLRDRNKERKEAQNG